MELKFNGNGCVIKLEGRGPVVTLIDPILRLSRSRDLYSDGVKHCMILCLRFYVNTLRSFGKYDHNVLFCEIVFPFQGAA